MYKIITTSISYLAIVCCTTAQTKIDTLPKLYTQQDVQVLGVRASAKAPFTSVTLYSKDIKLQNFGQDLPYILNQTPNTVIHSDAGNGVGYTGIRIRGTDATRINITINGIPYNDAESQGVFFVNIPDILSSTSSIQLQRGVGSSTHGSGAFGANISLSTYNHIQPAYLAYDASLGSYGTTKHTLQLGTGKLGKYLQYTGRLSTIQSNGYIERASTKLYSTMHNLTMEKNKTTLQLNIIAGKEKTYQAWYGVPEYKLITNRRYNSAGTAKPGLPYENETDNYTQNHYQLLYTQKINNSWLLNAAAFVTTGSGYYEQYKAEEKYSKYGLTSIIDNGVTYTKTDLIRQLWLQNTYYGITYSTQYNYNAGTVTLGGLAALYNGMHYGKVVWATRGISKNHTWYNLTANKNESTTYAKWQHDVNNVWNIYTDMQYRYVSYNNNGYRNTPDITTDVAYHFVNPKLGLRYYNAAKRLVTTISYAVAHKEPNRDDFEASVNALPKAEQLHNMEINMVKKMDNAQWNATLYYMHYNNQLILNGKVNDVGAYVRQNVPKSYRAGIELQYNKVFNNHLKAEGNIAWSTNKIKRYTEYTDDYDNGTQLETVYHNSTIAYSPSIVAAASITYTPNTVLLLMLQGKYVHTQYLDNTQSKSKMLNGYYTQDVQVTYIPTIRKLNEMRITARINNLLNTLYEPNGYTYSYKDGGVINADNYYYPAAGINFMLGISVRLEAKK